MAVPSPVIPKIRYGLTPAVMRVGGAEQGDRTMIDALAPALKTLPDVVIAAARGGANATAKMTRAKAGGQAICRLTNWKVMLIPAPKAWQGCLPIWRGFETNLGK